MGVAGLCAVPREAKVRIDHETFQAIKSGMHEREIQRLIGAPPGDYRTADVDYMLARVEPGDTRADGGETRLCRWVGDQGIINVIVGPTGQLVSATFYTGRRQPFSAVTRIRRIVGW
jgi:hypothetical protein